MNCNTKRHYNNIVSFDVVNLIYLYPHKKRSATPVQQYRQCQTGKIRDLGLLKLKRVWCFYNNCIILSFAKVRLTNYPILAI